MAIGRNDKTALKIPSLDEIDAALSRKSLRYFIKNAWNTLEPATPYRHNWHIDAIADHLEAVSSGQIRRLIINIPPGHMKSLSVCVFWPAWQWLQAPHYRFLFASYASELSNRDSRKTRDLINSEWYQRHFSDRYRLTKAVEHRIDNDRQGFRLASSVGGVGTGERVHVSINDDLIRANDAGSPAMRAQCIEHMRAMSTRGVDPATFAQVLIMQRVHENDPTGWAMEQWPDCDRLILPAEYDPHRRCTTSIGFSDPRTEQDQLLWPEMYPRTALDDLKTALGSYGAAAQLQQTPTPGDGGEIKPDMIQVVDALPAGLKTVRAWDFASSTVKTGSNPDWTVGAQLGRDDQGRFYITDITRFRENGLFVERALQNTAQRDGKDCHIDFPQDPGSAGKSLALRYSTLLAGYVFSHSTESGDKVTRAKPLISQIEAGNVYMLRASWNNALIDEMRMFPLGKHDDQIDALSRAFNKLADLQQPTKKTGMLDYLERLQSGNTDGH
jgi:predicted phage terminase large subunit-like protein